MGESYDRYRSPEGESASADEALRRRIRNARADAQRFENDTDHVLVVGRDGILLYLSQSFEEVFDAAPSSLVGLPLRQALSHKNILRPNIDAIVRELGPRREGASREPICISSLNPAGDVRHLEGHAYPIMPDPDQTIAIFRDSTGRADSLAAICESEQRFRRVAEASRDLVCEMDGRGHLTYVSRACLDVLGYEPEELMGTRALDVCHPEEFPEFLEKLREGRKSPESFEVGPHRLRHKSGSWIWAEATGRVFVRPGGERCTIGVARDVTAQVEARELRQELEGSVMRMQRLEGLGILAGGVGHDFNNLLTPILGNAAILHADLPANSPLRKRVDMIRRAARRATDLTGQLLAYAGEGTDRVAPVNISQNIHDMVLLLESTTIRAAELRVDLDANLPVIEIDPSHIGQVVMNLVANASDSLPASGGNIDLRTGLVEASRETLDACTIGRDCEAGRYVFLEVQDDGQGIEHAERTRIFDPFFSTRRNGRGLGLAAVHGIVGSYQGAIEVDSTPLEGTRVRVLFPVFSGDLRAPG